MSRRLTTLFSLFCIALIAWFLARATFALRETALETSGSASRLAENAAAADGNAGLLAYLRQHGPTHADVLADATGLSAAAANAALVGLEMLGKVRRLPGARYEVTA